MRAAIGIFGTLIIELVLATTLSAQPPTSQKPNMMANVPETEATFTEEQLKDYYLVYENKAVRHVRTVVDRYLTNPKKPDDETANLKSIERGYLTGKFNVLSQNPDMFGNTHILLIAVDKPDKVFRAIVYTGNGFRLDLFEVDSDFNIEDMRRIRIRYRKFLEDKKHAI